MLAGMNIHVADDRPSDKQRQLDALAKEHAKGRLFSRSRTVLSKGMTEIQESWLLDYVCSRWQALYGGLDSWRVKMGRFERMADDNYDDRKIPNPDLTDATEAVFKRQNFTLGMAAGFADFVYAQARDDIFGTRPWLAATPDLHSGLRRLIFLYSTGLAAYF